MNLTDLKIGRWYRVTAFERETEYLIKPISLAAIDAGYIKADYRYMLDDGKFNKSICTGGLFCQIANISCHRNSLTRDRRKAKGLCYECGEHSPAKDKLSCGDCLRIKRIKRGRYIEKKKLSFS